MKTKPFISDIVMPIVVAAALCAAVVGCEYVFWSVNHPGAPWRAFLIH